MYLNKLKHLAILSVTVVTSVFFAQVFAQDSLWDTFDTQDATGLGSNNSLISVDSNLEYYNKGDNSSVVGNYFEGEYYDSVFGFFTTDWSTNQSENVRIVSSYSGCPSSYGYKLGGYAYSSYFGFVDFDFNDDIFVYYCDSTQTFGGYSYSSILGFQNFEGISMDADTFGLTTTEIPDGDDIFTNNDTSITGTPTRTGTFTGSHIDNSNYTQKSIQFDTIEFDTEEENTFFIIK